MNKRSVNKRLLAIGFTLACAGPMSIAPLAGQSAPAPVAAATQRAAVDKYCVVCHNAKLKTANLLLDQLDLAHLGAHADIGEKVVRKLRAGMMPPTGMPQPDPATRDSLITWMEKELRSQCGLVFTRAGSASPQSHRIYECGS